jgi:hypothetical protein
MNRALVIRKSNDLKTVFYRNLIFAKIAVIRAEDSMTAKKRMAREFSTLFVCHVARSIQLGR